LPHSVYSILAESQRPGSGTYADYYAFISIEQYNLSSDAITAVQTNTVLSSWQTVPGNDTSM